MFLEAALLGLVVGWLRGGTLNKLGQVNLKLWPLALLALVIQAAIWADFHNSWYILSGPGPGLHILSFLPLLLFVYENLDKPGMSLLGLGVLLNLIVITLNGGRMPVRVDALPDQARQALISGDSSPFHAAMTEETLLPFLGDMFAIPFYLNQVLSVGDVLMSVGIFLIAQSFIKPKKKSG